jgi:hypothetical protein
MILAASPMTAINLQNLTHTTLNIPATCSRIRILGDSVLPAVAMRLRLPDKENGRHQSLFQRTVLANTRGS